MSGLSISSVLDELVEGLTALPALAEWFVSFGPAGATAPEKTIEIGHDSMAWSEEPLGMGQDSRLEEYDIPGRLYWAEPAGADGDNPAKKRAMDSALETFLAVEGYLADYQSDTFYIDGQIGGGTVALLVVADPFNGWAATVEFTIPIKAVKTP